VLKNTGYSGIHLAGGAPANPQAPGTIVEGNDIRENSRGGIVYSGGSPATVGTPFITVRNNLVRGNTSDRGAALHLTNFYGRISNNTIVRNISSTTSYNQHGAIYVRNDAGTGAPMFFNNIIAHNSAGIYDYTSTGTRLYTLSNAFFANATGEQAYDYHAVFANPDPTVGNGNIKADPRFAYLSSYEGLCEYRLDAASPCIDAGDDTVSVGSVDLDGEPRRDGARIDIGAYENIHGLTLAFVVQPQNGVVDEDMVPAPAVSIFRPNGQVYPHASAVWVTLKPGTGGPGAVLYCHTGLGGGIGDYYVNGVATFERLYMWQAGTGNVLTAKWAGVTADSQPFNMMLRRRYVNPAGDDANDGSTWAEAKRTIGSAVDAVLAPGGEVLVGKGTYTGPFTLPAGAKLLGGYDGEAPCWDCRDFRRNVSVLDGAQGGPVVTVASGAGPETLLEGFTIRNGSGRRFLGTLRRAYWKGGGIYSLDASATIRDNRVIENTATVGGGIYIEGGEPVLLRNIIEANTATATAENAATGGGLALLGGSATITGNLIRNNSATGGPMLGDPDGRGGGVWCSESEALFLNNTLQGNTATHLLSGVLEIPTGRPRFVNNIIAYNEGGIYAGKETEVFAASNDVYHNYEPDYTGPGDPFGERRNMALNPRFVSLSTGDLHLRDDSPCINAGDNSLLVPDEVDLDGNPRLNDDIVDLGAYERRVLNVLSARFVDATHVEVRYSDFLDTDPAKGAFIPSNYTVVDLDNAGVPLQVTLCTPVLDDHSRVLLAFGALPYGHLIRITVNNVRSSVGILINPLRNITSLVLPVQVTFHLTDYLGPRPGSITTVRGDFNEWKRGPSLQPQVGTYVSVSPPVWVTPGRVEYRYCLTSHTGEESCDILNAVNRDRTLLPVHPQTVYDVIGADVRTTFNLTVYATRAIPAGKDVYVTGGFTSWSTTPGATPGPIKLNPLGVSGGKGLFTATATIKQMAWAYRYILVDQATGAVDSTWLNSSDRGMDMQPTGAPLAFVVNDSAGTPTKLEIAARILRVASGMEPAPSPPSDPSFVLLDVNGDNVIDRLDAVKALR